MKLKRKMFALILILTVLGEPALKAQDSLTSAVVKTAVADTNYYVGITSVKPMRGITRQLTPGYFLVVTKKTVRCHLPYFGRAYNTGYSSSGGGIRFISDRFQYSSATKDNKKWDIIIQPKNERVAKMSITLFDNGHVTIYVSSNDRDAISYSGDIRLPKH